MELFQQVQLEAKLEELLFRGQTSITWQQLYCWYDVERLSTTPWRDIQRRWDVLCQKVNGKTTSLKVRGMKGGFGGVHLYRPFLERFDGSEDDFSSLV